MSIFPSETVAFISLELTYLARLAGLGSPGSLPPQHRDTEDQTQGSDPCTAALCWPTSSSAVSGECAEDMGVRMCWLTI